MSPQEMGTKSLTDKAGKSWKSLEWISSLGSGYTRMEHSFSHLASWFRQFSFFVNHMYTWCTEINSTSLFTTMYSTHWKRFSSILFASLSKWITVAIVPNDWDEVLTANSLVKGVPCSCVDVDVDSTSISGGGSMLRSKPRVCVRLCWEGWRVFIFFAYVHILSGTSRREWHFECRCTHLRTLAWPVRNKAVVRDSIVSESPMSVIWLRHARQFFGIVKKTQMQRLGCWFENEAPSDWFFMRLAVNTYWAEGK